MSRLMKDMIFGYSIIVSLVVGATLDWGIVLVIAWWLLVYAYTQIPKYLARREAARRAMILGPRPLMYRCGQLVPAPRAP